VVFRGELGEPGKQLIALAERNLECPGDGELLTFHSGCLSRRSDGRWSDVAFRKRHLLLRAKRSSGGDCHCADQKQSKKAAIAKSAMTWFHVQ
jgi:hypothetical protein